MSSILVLSGDFLGKRANFAHGFFGFFDDDTDREESVIAGELDRLVLTAEGTTALEPGTLMDLASGGKVTFKASFKDGRRLHGITDLLTFAELEGYAPNEQQFMTTAQRKAESDTEEAKKREKRRERNLKAVLWSVLVLIIFVSWRIAISSTV